MTKRNTKESILNESLKLFAERGYDSVSVRDIAAAVGIQQSSLYKHFKNKKDIFDTLVQKMYETALNANVSLDVPNGEFEKVSKEYATNGIDFLKELSASIFLYYLKDPYSSQFRKMLSIEKYKSEEAKRIYNEIFIDANIEYQSKIFATMIEQGYMKPVDPKIMALQFYSPIVLLINKYDSMPASMEKEALEILGKHIVQFDSIYRKEV